jgi:hypothetical protein
MAAPDAVGVKVLPIDREALRRGEGLGGHDEGASLS